MNDQLLVYNDYYERTKTFNEIEKVRKVFDNRTKQTYLLKGIESIEIPRRNELDILFSVIETDDHLIKKGMPIDEREFFVSRYVFSHLAGFLGVPSKLYDLVDIFWVLPEDKRIECTEYLGGILTNFFNHRLEQQENNSRLKDIYITVFNDVWGEFPRVIHSDVYYPYPDGSAFEMLLKGVETINQQNPDRQYTFQTAELSPYQSVFNFTNYKSRTQVRPKETIESGISVMNSECKKASFNFQDYVLRLECINGIKSRHRDNDLSVRHYESGFQQKIQNAFVKALRLEDEFASKYIKAVEYDQEISDDWADLLDIPSSILALNKGEKQDLIELGRTKYKEFTPYNVLNVLTDKATHGVHNDADKERYNEKAVIILDNIEKLSVWKPRTVA